MNKITIEEEGVESKNSPKKSFKLKTVWIALCVLLILVGLTIGIVFSTKPKKNFVPDIENSRIDCLPWFKNKENIKLESECAKMNLCKYQNIDDNKKIPSCYYDTERLKLRLVETQSTDLGKTYRVFATNGAKSEPVTLKVEFEYLDDFALRFKIHNEAVQEYEVPIQINKPNRQAKNPKYDVIIDETNDNFNFKILRKATNTVIWDTSLGPIIYEKFNKQISTKLPSINVYGFGENKHKSFRHDLSYQNWPIFGRDERPETYDNGNLYSNQPFYTCMENDGKSHGVALVNSNALDYEFIPNPGLVYRATGGVLDFYVFMGPEPENVIQQFTKYFGRSHFPPYWALGFQISRYGYLDLDDMKKVLDRFDLHQIPLDTQVADIDHFDQRKDFTIDKKNWADLPKYFDYLHKRGMKTVLLLDPGLVVNDTSYWPYITGRQQNVFVNWPKGASPDFDETGSDIMLGYCWPPAKIAYPDFMKKSTQKWWVDSIMRHHETLDFDGLWIDMNEPATFGTNDERPFNWPPENKPYWSLKCPDDEYELVKTKASYLYQNNNKLSQKTICMSGLHGELNEYKHFDVHNLYGYFESMATYEAARKINNNNRGFVITRSTFLGGGKYGGHWTGDNHSLWSHLYYSIIGMLEFNLFGITYVGADICGFSLNTTDELCSRWSSLGAFYPFSRNHNDDSNIHQDPGFLSMNVVRSAKNALEVRYEILPYYYTLFYKAHTKGNTVVRPLFHEFPLDNNTYSIDKQFLVGPAFLVTPVLEEKKVTVDGYFPAGNWYNYYDGELVASNQDKSTILKLNAPIDYIPLHIRGGYIIPTQGGARTTEESRKNPFGLIVSPDSEGEAKGDLFYDDGSSDIEKNKYYIATFFLRENVLKMNVEVNSYAYMNSMVLNKIRIFVKPNNKIKFILNKRTILTNDKIEWHNHQVILNNLNITMSEGFELEWTTESWVNLAPSSLRSPTIIDCSIQNNSITEIECLNKRCIFDPQALIAPRCYVPTNLGGYRVLLIGTNLRNYNLVKSDSFSLFGKDVFNLSVQVTHGLIRNSNINKKMTRIKIFDRNNKRYEVPVNLNYDLLDNESHLNVKLDNSYINSKAYIEVTNKYGHVLFDTKQTEHGFVFSDQFIQMYLNLRDYKNSYGLGESTHESYKHKYSYSNWWGLFGRDQPPGAKTINLYGTHPFFMAVNEKTGRAFGCLILNSNAQEYGLLPPNTIGYRTLGGILDFYLMEEDSPEALIQAYTSLIGLPYFPPYWSLGFQLSRYGYNSLEKLKSAVDRTLTAKIPFDVQYADIDHFRKQLDFTLDEVAFKGLPEYITEIRRKHGIRFIIILDPAINMEEKNYKPYLNGLVYDAFIKWPSDQNPQLNETSDKKNKYVVGYVWPEGKTVFPDFMKKKTQEWWKLEISDHYKYVLTFDGLWIDMNEPANFDTNELKPWNWPASRPPWNLVCPKNTYDDPPYLPLVARPYGNIKRISDKTICMRALQGENDEYIHYDVHNLYGWSQSPATLEGLRETLFKRSIVITRSTFPSSGKHAGHWLGDNTSIWPHLRHNIIGLLEFNLFGIPYVGADICGFFGDATPEMCTRWTQLGAFNTFFRNHNGFNGIEQDPLALGKDVADASRQIIEIRYSLLPYLYSLFYHVNKNGGTVIRSLMHEFPRDPRALDIDSQFMWGSSLMISPVLQKNARTVYAYFPNARWFDFYTGKEIEQVGRIHELDAPLDFLPLHVKGNSIIVTQEPGLNTDQSRLNPYGLIIAPGSGTVQYKTNLYLDEGDIIDPTNKTTFVELYTYAESSQITLIKITPILTNYILFDSNNLKTIKIFGVKSSPTLLRVNNENYSKFDYDSESKVLTINDLKIRFDSRKETIININRVY